VAFVADERVVSDKICGYKLAKSKLNRLWI